MREGENGEEAAHGSCRARPRKGERAIRIRRQSAAQMPLGFRSDVSNGSGISMANGTCQILAACLAKGFAKSSGTAARAPATDIQKKLKGAAKEFR